jgi:hypothetical protein
VTYSVPEPLSLGIVSLCAVGLLRQRPPRRLIRG